MASRAASRNSDNGTIRRATGKSPRRRHNGQELHWLRAALDTLADCVLIVDRLGLDLVAVNQAACRSLGYSRRQLLAMRLSQLVPEASLARIVAEPGTRDAAAMDGVVLPVLQRCHDGSEIAMEWAVRPMPRCGGRLMMVVARPLGRSEEGGIWPDPGVHLDPLTGLPDRQAFEARLARVLCHSRRQVGGGFAVFFVDLDRFKPVNDVFGHVRGDQLLWEVARRLVDGVRSGDMVARRGGDEFTVLVDPLQDRRDAIGVAERIQSQLNAPLEFHGQSLTITASIGIAMSTPRYRAPEEMIHDADRAMYHAKAAGGARHVVFEENLATATGYSPSQS